VKKHSDAKLFNHPINEEKGFGKVCVIALKSFFSSFIIAKKFGVDVFTIYTKRHAEMVEKFKVL